jgi:tetratricopeptide (TPR) repeat protein
MGLERLPAALAIHQRALALRGEVLRSAPDDAAPQADLAESHLELGRVYARREDPAAAEREWRRAVALLERALATSDIGYHRTRFARALLELGERERARPVVERLRAEGPLEPELLELAQRHDLAG